VTDEAAADQFIAAANAFRMQKMGMSMTCDTKELMSRPCFDTNIAQERKLVKHSKRLHRYNDKT
jgi:hypothetical protein